MKYLISSLLVVAIGIAVTMILRSKRSVTITHGEFLFSLSSDWLRVQSTGPDQFTCESKAKKSTVVLSIIPDQNIPIERLKEVATKLAQEREDVERTIEPGRKLEFGDKWVQLQPSGDVAEVAYAGYDLDNKFVFRFVGFVTQKKIMSLWVSTSTTDNEFSKQVFDEVYKALKFYVP